MVKEEPELNERGYPKFLDRIMEYTGTTYEDIEREKKEQQQEFSDWVDIVNLKKRFERGEITIEEYEKRGLEMLAEPEYFSIKVYGGRHE
jgi:hypothetical protein